MHNVSFKLVEKRDKYGIFHIFLLFTIVAFLILGKKNLADLVFYSYTIFSSATCIFLSIYYKKNYNKIHDKFPLYEIDENIVCLRNLYSYRQFIKHEIFNKLQPIIFFSIILYLIFVIAYFKLMLTSFDLILRAIVILIFLLSRTLCCFSTYYYIVIKSKKYN